MSYQIVYRGGIGGVYSMGEVVRAEEEKEEESGLTDDEESEEEDDNDDELPNV